MLLILFFYYSIFASRDIFRIIIKLYNTHIKLGYYWCIVLARPSSASFFSTQSHAVGGRATSPRPLTPIAQQMPPPPHHGNYMPKSLLQPVADTPKCSECSKYIVWVPPRLCEWLLPTTRFYLIHFDSCIYFMYTNSSLLHSHNNMKSFLVFMYT